MSGMDTSFVGKFRMFLFKNLNAKKENHPQWQGRAVFTPEQVRRLVERVKGKPEEAEIECEVAGWVKKDKNGNDYIFGSVETAEKKPYVPDEENVPF